MKKIFKNKLLMIFLSVAVVITVILLMMTSYFIGFMADTITKTTEDQTIKNQAIKFNFDKLKLMNIIQN